MTTFDLTQFRVRHDPVVIGKADPTMFQCRCYAIRILDMPVKLPFGEIVLPRYARRFRSFVGVVDAYVGVRGRGRYAYLTVDQGLVKAGQSQRAAGCHVDGFQGTRVQPKVETDFSFVVADDAPTVFYRQTWEVDHLDVASDNIFRAFDRQACQECAWIPERYEIVECSAYTVHRAAVVDHDVVRTFLRLSYSVREFDRLGNSINPLLDCGWNYVSRDTPKHLTTSEADTVSHYDVDDN